MIYEFKEDSKKFFTQKKLVKYNFTNLITSNVISGCIKSNTTSKRNSNTTFKNLNFKPKKKKIIT